MSDLMAKQTDYFMPRCSLPKALILRETVHTHVCCLQTGSISTAGNRQDKEGLERSFRSGR